MNIPAKIVIQKMEEELAKLKATLSDGDFRPTSTSSFAEPAMALKTYCDLLLASEPTKSSEYHEPPLVKHASVEDLETRNVPHSTSNQHGMSSSKTAGNRGDRTAIYDLDEEPDSDSLLDF